MKTEIKVNLTTEGLRHTIKGTGDVLAGDHAIEVLAGSALVHKLAREVLLLRELEEIVQGIVGVRIAGEPSVFEREYPTTYTELRGKLAAVAHERTRIIEGGSDPS